MASGDQLGRYHLVRKLATGGMAEVFLAKVQGPGGFEKSLVIKRMLPALAKDPQFVELFLQEARMAAQFAHPAVVQIFDFGEVDGQFFLAMEFIDGQNLKSIVRALPERRLSPALAARIVEQACEGLAYVHEFADASGQPLGLMHCDVSTDNLIIARNGAVKIVDFGVAKGAGQVSNAEPGTVRGKIAYMPAEQIIGEADHRADLYALGVILYELVAGVRPYDNLPDQELMAAIIKTDPTPLNERRPDVPPEFARLVAKAMARRPEDRFQTGRELGAALDDFLSQRGERVGPRQLAALAVLDTSGAKPVTAPTPVPAPRSTTPTGNSPARGTPRADPFAAFGKPITPPTSRGSGLTPAPQPAPKPATSALFDELFNDLDDAPPAPAGSPLTVTSGSASTSGGSASGAGFASAAGPAFTSAGSPSTGGSANAAGSAFTSAGSPSNAGSSSNAGSASAAGSALTFGGSASTPASSAFTSTGSATTRVPPLTSPVKPAVVPAVAPPRVPAPPPPPRSDAEVRAQVLLADASAMRLYEAGSLLGTPSELDAARSELERDEGLHLLVRFPRNAARLLKLLENDALIAPRVAGAVEGLLLAEAYGALATMLEQLQAHAGGEPHERRVFELARGTLATTGQAQRLTRALREAAPSDVEGLGRLLPFFGGEHAALWLTLFESIELPASREAVLPGLAGLAALNPAPFLERLAPKRPRRLIELAYCLEKGRVGARQRTLKDLMARLDPSRRREVLTGLARAGTDDALRWLTQSLTEGDEDERVLTTQLLGQHFPERVFQVLGPLLKGNDARSERERRAMWVAIGHSTEPHALDAIVTELRQSASLLNRAKVEARKVDALEAVAVMKSTTATDLLRTISRDATQPEVVRAAAQRHLRAAALLEQTAAEQAAFQSSESRRWDRTPGTWRDVLLDLDALASTSRVLELSHPSLTVAFTRLVHRLESLLPREGQVEVTVGTPLRINGQPVVESADAELDAVAGRLSQRAIARFAFVRKPARPELENLARWLAGGSATAGVVTPSILRGLSIEGVAPLDPPMLTAPTSPDDSREAMVRYVDLVFAFRGWLTERQRNPAAPMPDVRAKLHELALLVDARRVRFVGVTPRANNRDAELFHQANVALLALVFAAELGLSPARRFELATCAFFADVGNLELKDETLQRAGRLTEEDQRDVARARKRSATVPFVLQGDARPATSWAAVIAEQDVEWGAREAPGGVGVTASVGLLGSLVALARAWETMTTSTATREGLSRDAAADALATRVSHRFRPELLSLFLRFVRRLSTRPVQGR